MSTETFAVHILGKDYQVACLHEDRDALLRAAAELDKRMRDIRLSGSVIGVERIAVMAALNLSNEVLQAGHPISEDDDALLRDLHQRLDKALS
ncbi:MAG: cell division protein ZapA [Cellvibrionaceae bacterium]|jgi:cell division protein ZapA